MHPTPKGSRTMFAQFLRNISRKLFRQAVAGNSRHKPIRRKLQVEALETRDLMAAGLSAHLSQGILTIDATPRADKIILREIHNRIAIVGVATTFDARKVNSIVVDLFQSNDTI